MHLRKEEGRKLQACSREHVHCVLCLKVFIGFLKAGILGEVSEEDLNGTFISFPGVSFNKLNHQGLGLY